MSRQRYQRGRLKTFVPAAKGKPKRQLPRGSYWARWYRYIRQADGREKRSPREKIITRELARSFRIATEYEGPLTKADAQRVLDLLIARDAGTYTPPDAAATFWTSRARIPGRRRTGLGPAYGSYLERSHRIRVDRRKARFPFCDRDYGDRAAAIPERACIRRSQSIEVGEGAPLLAQHSRPRGDEKDHLGQPSAESGLSAEGEIAQDCFRTVLDHGRVPTLAFCGCWRGSCSNSYPNPTGPAVRRTLRAAPG